MTQPTLQLLRLEFDHIQLDGDIHTHLPNQIKQDKTPVEGFNE